MVVGSTNEQVSKKTKWITNILAHSSIFEGKCLVGTELDAAILASGLCCLACVVIDDAHNTVHQNHAAFHRVRLATIHAKTASHAFLLVDARPLFCTCARSCRHEILLRARCNKAGDIRAKSRNEKEF